MKSSDILPVLDGIPLSAPENKSAKRVVSVVWLFENLYISRNDLDVILFSPERYSETY